MTYCVAVKTKEGLIALADGRITAGSLVSNARKMTLFGEGKNRFFVTTSGLRSIRDKTIAYLQREINARPEGFSTMLDMVGCYTRCLRQVEVEDRAALEQAKLTFNFHSIIGGIMPEDKEPHLYLVYPEGNWIEVDQVTPYVTIGAVGYGKPILDRTLKYASDMTTALKVLYLSFDSTLFSSSDVGFPINILTYSKLDGAWRESHLEEENVKELRVWWNENLSSMVTRAPEGAWIKPLVTRD